MTIFRYLLWILLIYFAWRIIRSFVALYGRSRKKRENVNPPYANIEEADFEDITAKRESEGKETNSNSSQK